MKQSIPQFFELPDEIPYSKILSLTLISANYANGIFTLKLNRKCENMPEESGYQITRTLSDFHWVRAKIKEECPLLVVLPSLPEEGWLPSGILSIGETQQNKKIKSWYTDQYNSQAIERFMKLIIEVVRPNLYKVPGFVKTSLFVFLDKSYQLFKTYEQPQPQSKQKSEQPQSTLSMLTTGLSKGGMKILGLFIKKQNSPVFKQHNFSDLTKLNEESSHLSKQLVTMHKNLSTLQTNIFQEKQKNEMKDKIAKVFELEMRCMHLERITVQILKEMKRVENKFQEAKAKCESQDSIKEQVDLYQKFLSKEVKGFKAEWVTIMQEIYREIYLSEVQIKLSVIDPSKYGS